MNLWKLNERVGTFDLQRDVTPETAEAWLAVFRKDEPSATFVVAAKRPVTEAEKALRKLSRERKASK